MGEEFGPQCYEVLSSSCQRVKKTFWTIFFLHFFSFFLSLAFALDSIHLMLGDEPKCKFWMTLRYFILTRWLSTGSSNWKCDMQNWNLHHFSAHPVFSLTRTSVSHSHTPIHMDNHTHTYTCLWTHAHFHSHTQTCAHIFCAKLSMNQNHFDFHASIMTHRQ